MIRWHPTLKRLLLLLTALAGHLQLVVQMGYDGYFDTIDKTMVQSPDGTYLLLEPGSFAGCACRLCALLSLSHILNSGPEEALARARYLRRRLLEIAEGGED